MNELEKLDIEIYEMKEKVEKLEYKREKLRAKKKCNHIYKRNGFMKSSKPGLDIFAAEIIICVECGESACLIR